MVFVYSFFLKLKGCVSMDFMYFSDWVFILYGCVGGNIIEFVDLDGVDMWIMLLLGLVLLRKELVYNIDFVDWVVVFCYQQWKFVVNMSMMLIGFIFIFNDFKLRCEFFIEVW